MFCEKQESIQNLKVIKQNRAKLVYLFVSKIFSIKKELSCSICFEVFHQPVKLSGCCHFFCENCIVTHSKYLSTKTLLCPICQKPFALDKLIPLTYLHNISLLIISASDKINHLLGTSNEIPTLSKILEMDENVMSQFFGSQTISIASSFDYSTILNAKKLLICSDNTVLKYKNDSLNNIENISLRKKNKTIDSLKQTEDSSKIVTKCKQNSVANNEVVEWLQDDRNKFDYKSPSDGTTDTQLFEFNMPSVSQIDAQKKQNSSVKKNNSKTDILTHTLECVVKNVKPISKLKHAKKHNTLTNNNDVIRIEQVNSEDDVIVIDNPAFKKAAIKRKESKNDLGKLSEWNNIKQIKKTLKESCRKTNKLTVLSRHSSSESIGQQKSNTSKISGNLNDMKCLSKQVDQSSLTSVGKENAPLSKINNLNVTDTTKIIQETNTKKNNLTVESNIDSIDPTSQQLKPKNVKVEVKSDFMEIKKTCVLLKKLVQNDQLSQNNANIPFSNEKEDNKENRNEVVRHSLETIVKTDKKELSNINPESKVLIESNKSNIQETEKKLENNIQDVPNQLNNEDQDDKFFNRPTQVIESDICISQNIFEENETTFIQNKIGSIYKILRTLDRNSIKQDLINSFTSIKEILSKIEKTVFTKESSKLHKHAETQTEVCGSPGGFRISSTETFNTQPISSSYVQTDTFTCLKCNSLLINCMKDTYTTTHFHLKDQDVQKCKEKNINAEVTESASTKTSKSYKRIRVPSTESDSDCEILSKYVSKNKYKQDDLSFKFISEPSLSIKPTNSKSSKDLFCDILVEDKTNNRQNLEKHDEDMDVIVIQSIPEEPPSKRLKCQNTISECKMIIKDASSVPMTIEDTEKFTTNSNIHFEREYVKPTVLSLALLEDEFNHNFIRSQKNVEENKLEHPINLNKSKVCKSLFADDIDDMKVIVDHINEREIEGENSKKGNINILQNVVVKTATLQSKEEIEEAVEEEEDVTVFHISISSDEVFNPEMDVINTTPQKTKTPSLKVISSLSSIHNITNSKEIEPPNDVLLQPFFNRTFSPPPEFQDKASDDIDDNQKTVIQISEKENLKPKVPLETQQSESEQMSYADFVQKCPLFTSTPCIEYSQKISTAKGKPYEDLKSPGATSIKSKTSPSSVCIMNTSTPKKVIERKKPWIACTRLNKEQLSMINALFLKELIIYSKTFNANVTHMIINVNEDMCVLDHTMKYISAVAAGIWVLSFDWVKKCLEQNTIVSEEPFEVLDISKIDGPKQSRLNRLKTPLLENYKIYVAPILTSTTVKEVQDVILLLGGSVVSSLEQLISREGKICLVIADGMASGGTIQFDSWLEKFKVITVELEWLSRSVGQFKIVSILSYMLCSEDSIPPSNYPREILSDSPILDSNS